MVRTSSDAISANNGNVSPDVNRVAIPVDPASLSSSSGVRPQRMTLKPEGLEAAVNRIFSSGYHRESAPVVQLSGVTSIEVNTTQLGGGLFRWAGNFVVTLGRDQESPKPRLMIESVPPGAISVRFGGEGVIIEVYRDEVRLVTPDRNSEMSIRYTKASQVVT